MPMRAAGHFDLLVVRIEGRADSLGHWPVFQSVEVTATMVESRVTKEERHSDVSE
jgi:hypothetical protein